VQLGTNATVELGTSAGEAIVGLSAQGSAGPSGNLVFRLTEANVSLPNFNISGVSGKTGAIQIKNLHDASLSFDPSGTPRILEGSLTEATAKDVEINRTKKP
jgi:hypothetical protein